MSISILPPQSTIGILGGGQLGKMLAMAAQSLGYRTHIFSPSPDDPARAVANETTLAAYEDLDQVAGFAKKVNCVTFEFENIFIEAARTAAEHTLVRPRPEVLFTAQNRLREKGFLQAQGFPVGPYLPVHNKEQLLEAVQQLRCPCVLKSADFGYDGKGQFKINSPSECETAWKFVNAPSAILESWIPFEKELSAIVARSPQGECRSFPLFENSHSNHILDVSFIPAAIPPEVENEGQMLGRAIAESLGVIGLLTVEFFLTGNGSLLVNELAPRTHNSGHLTLNACHTSQFEQQIRAICALPLGDPSPHQPSAAMANLLGDLWQPHPPLWEDALRDPGIKLHLYGKTKAAVGRKMGHLTVTDLDSHSAVKRVCKARHALTRPAP